MESHDSSPTPFKGKATFVDLIRVTTLSLGIISTLLHIPPGQGHKFDLVLLDAGEGNLGQIKQKFRPGWKETWKNLKMILKPHSHADHHCGLPSLLAEGSKVINSLTSKK
ncbi:hypothetical protein KEM48_011864 [Puccinia striiformis f. sp. tritici PST-130]|nr:hypothetical protein KEM48_011864 [Puccinia striiformis f. sp. tritici PST-130]